MTGARTHNHGTGKAEIQKQESRDSHGSMHENRLQCKKHLCREGEQITPGHGQRHSGRLGKLEKWAQLQSASITKQITQQCNDLEALESVKLCGDLDTVQRRNKPSPRTHRCGYNERIAGCSEHAAGANAAVHRRARGSPHTQPEPELRAASQPCAGNRQQQDHAAQGVRALQKNEQQMKEVKVMLCQFRENYKNVKNLNKMKTKIRCCLRRQRERRERLKSKRGQTRWS